MWKNNDFLPIYIWNKNIWIIKKDWEKSFLSFEDVFDNDWKLIFIKWWIYNIEIDWEKIKGSKYEKYNKIDLLNFEWNITRNPMRLINKFKQEKFEELNTTSELKNNFNSIVYNFREHFLKD